MVNKLAWVFGIVFLAIGVLGFVPGITADGLLLGIFEVDTLHNIIHILSGVLAIAAALAGRPKIYFQVFGAVYAVVAVVGFIQGDTVLGLFTTNMADHLLHVGLAVALLYIGFGMKEESRMSAMSGMQGAAM